MKKIGTAMLVLETITSVADAVKAAVEHIENAKKRNRDRDYDTDAIRRMMYVGDDLVALSEALSRMTLGEIREAVERIRDLALGVRYRDAAETEEEDDDAAAD